MMKVTLLAFTFVYVYAVSGATYLSCSPSSGGVGICSEMCSADEECSQGEKCCSNGCGHACTKALVVPYHNPPLRCPAASVSQCTTTTTTTTCLTNANCSSGEMCCPTSSCGTTCLRGEPPTPLCPIVRDQVSNTTLIGAYLPTCEADGSFTPIQCHGSTGYCWCVDPVSGVPQSDMVRFQKPQCAPLAFFSCPAPQSEVVGTCDEQCDVTTGCQRGQKCCSNGCGHACTSALLPIPYVAPQKGAQSPFCEGVRQQVTSKGLLGGYTPQCDDASGNFLTLQCHESSCWCVNPENGQPTSDMVSGSAVGTLPCSGCYYNGTVHTSGEKFDFDICGGYCTCMENKSAVCTTVLCGPEDELIEDSDWWYSVLVVCGVIAAILALVTAVLFTVVVGVVKRQHQFRHMKVRTTEEFTVFTKYSPSDEETDLSRSRELRA